MPLMALEKFDKPTANAILAAAALSTAPQPGVDDQGDEFINRYKSEISELLAEIRKKLKLSAHDTSPRAKANIDGFLSEALEDYVLTNDAAALALNRAAQQGRISPAAYHVVQPESFRKRFYDLAITKIQVEEAVRQPDDYQHLFTEGAVEDEVDIFSLFMKRAGGKRKQEPNWLLVQCLRRGIEQVVQSAWRVYPQDVDLSSAQAPLDVLRLFVEKFGINVTVGQLTGKFIETMSMLKSADTELMQFGVQLEKPDTTDDIFLSASNRRTKNPALFKVGLVYCINIRLYREALIAHGAGVRPR